MATAPEAQLRHALAQADALLGLSRHQQQPTGKPSLAAVLLARLEAYSALAPPQPQQEPDSPAQDGYSTSTNDLDERALQHRTALAALALLERTASLLPSLTSSTAPSSAPSTSSSRPHTGTHAAPPPPPPLFGIGDAKALAQLAAVVGRWGIRDEPAPAHAKRTRAAEEPRIVELGPDDEADEAARRARREDVVRRVVCGVLGVDREVHVGAMMPSAKQFLGMVLPQLLRPLVGALADLGEGGGDDEGKWAREALERVFKLTPTPTVLSTLLALVAATRPGSASRARLSALLSAQLLHPTGVRSLFVVVVGVGSAAGGGGDDEVSVSKLEMVRRVVETPPVGGDDEAYYANVASQLLDLLRSAASSSLAASLALYAPNTGKGKSRLAPQPAAQPLSVVPAPIIRAAAWCVAHLVVAPPPTRSGRTASQRLLAAVHAPLLPATASAPSPSPGRALGGRPLATHLALVSLLALYAPPLPSLLSTLVAPLVPPLLALVAFLDAPRLVAPLDDVARALELVVRDEASALLGTWAKSVPAQEAVRDVARAVERWEAGDEFAADVRVGERAHDASSAQTAGRSSWKWAWGADGAPELVAEPEPEPAPSEEAGGAGAEFQLRVDAPWLVGWLAGLERKELAAGLFLRWLDEVKVLRGVEGVEGARRTVTRLQLVLQMVEHLGSDILADPREIIAFVAHALDAQVGEPGADARGSAGRKEVREEDERPRAGLAGLRIVEEDEGGPDLLEGAEQDEDESELGLGTGFGKDEMAMTALTLLLAVLEADDKLDMKNAPLLAVIYTQLETLQASTTSALIPPLAREVRMVLSLRRASSAFAASSSSTSTTNADGTPDPLAASRDTYRSALKLLQDPLLPVRAQGLHLLRSLVLDKEHALLSTDPALLPAVLDIFVAALEEEDSFLYLNAVQGLSSLVDVFGRQVVGRLLEVYTGRRRGEAGGPREVGEGERGMRELDKRLRVGETLTQVIQRAGEALAVLVDDILPSLLVVLRSSTLPVPLRASAITILAACVETAPTALVQHADVLTEACVTLLQVESVPLAPRARAAAAAAPVDTQARRRDKGKEKQGRPAVLIEEVGDSSSSSSSAASSDDDEPLFAQSQQAKDGVPPRPEELADPTTTSSKHPTLRRAAAVFLDALVRTVAHQAAEAAERREHAASAGYDERDPFGLGAGGIRMPFSSAVRAGSGDFLLRARPSQSEREASLLDPDQLVRARTVLRYVSETDEDALVREQTRQVLSELEG